MDNTNLAEISQVIFNYIWHQVQIRKDRIRQLLSTRINEEPIQQIIKQSGHEYQQTYYRHLMEIEKNYDRYISIMNHMASIIPCTPGLTDTVALCDRIISGWLLLLSINDQCRMNIKALPDVTDKEYRMGEVLKSSHQVFSQQLKMYMYFSLCLCFLVLTGIGSMWTRLLVVVVGSAYFAIRGVLFMSETAGALTKETENLKSWLQFKQEVSDIHQNLIGLTGLVHDTIVCVKTMWAEKKEQQLEIM